MTNPFYSQDGVTIYNADALDVLPSLRAASVDLVVTDPPYVIGAVSAGTLASKAGTWGDMMNSSRWFSSWYTMIRRILKPTGAMWTFCNWRSLPVVMKAGADVGWGITSLLVWDKDWIGPGGPQGLRPQYELVALFAMSEFKIPDRGTNDIWKEPWSAFKPNGHAAEKPVPLLERLIIASGLEPERVVLDPFMGSGSTIRAAENLDMEAIGIESEEQWCNVTIGRLSQMAMDLSAPFFTHST